MQDKPTHRLWINKKIAMTGWQPTDIVGIPGKTDYELTSATVGEWRPLHEDKETPRDTNG